MYLDHLDAIISEYYGRRLVRRLKPVELSQLWVLAHELAAITDANKRAVSVNRLFLDKPKPKNWTIISELLTLAASRSWRSENQAP